MEDVIWFLVNYPVFLLLVMNICGILERDRVTEALKAKGWLIVEKE
ncbi:MAG: hypothetical protein ACLTS6_05645 [Anaerobutyricum sp.]